MTDGGMGLKPSDRWCVSLCSAHHAEQHRLGEPAFEQRYGIDLLALAEAFAQRSPHRSNLQREIHVSGRGLAHGGSKPLPERPG